MAMNPLEAHVRQQSRVAIIDLHGEINSLSEDTLQGVYAEAEAGNPEVILLNFEGVDYINSTGIALIVSLLAKARAAHRRLLASGLSPHYVEIFEITRLADFMSVFSTEAQALQDVSAAAS